ncbi:MAG: hypothetical protein IPN18_03525 [Ignavibacteriales bacterium]|nr:hypothetical protein [Ignavibacteriales bacterium]
MVLIFIVIMLMDRATTGYLFDSLTYAGAIRDLATDGTRLFGGNAATGILEIDPNTGATVKTFTLTGGATRAIAWDATRKGFWNTAFGGNIFLHDTNGVLKTNYNKYPHR